MLPKDTLKGYAFGEQIREQIGERIDERKTTLKCIKNLMQTKQLSALEAMDALGIDESDRNRASYLKRLRIAQTC